MKKCTHIWLFLRQNKVWYGESGKYYDVFYCSKCLEYASVEVEDVKG